MFLVKGKQGVQDKDELNWANSTPLLKSTRSVFVTVLLRDNFIMNSCMCYESWRHKTAVACKN